MAVRYGTTYRRSKVSGVMGVRPNLFNYPNRRAGSLGMSGRDAVTISKRGTVRVARSFNSDSPS